MKGARRVRGKAWGNLYLSGYKAPRAYSTGQADLLRGGAGQEGLGADPREGLHARAEGRDHPLRHMLRQEGPGHRIRAHLRIPNDHRGPRSSAALSSSIPVSEGAPGPCDPRRSSGRKAGSGERRSHPWRYWNPTPSSRCLSPCLRKAPCSGIWPTSSFRI